MSLATYIGALGIKGLDNDMLSAEFDSSEATLFLLCEYLTPFLQTSLRVSHDVLLLKRTPCRSYFRIRMRGH